MPNLIVIMFNLMYPILFVGFHYKGFVRDRESVKTQGMKTKVAFAGSSQLSFPRSEACALLMRRVRIGWRQLVFASISWVRPSRETSVRHSVLPVCTIWYTFFVPTLFILLLPTNVKEYFWEKNLAKHLES